MDILKYKKIKHFQKLKFIYTWVNVKVFLNKLFF